MPHNEAMKTQDQIRIETLETALRLLIQQHQSMNIELCKIGKGRHTGHGSPIDAAMAALAKNENPAAVESAAEYVARVSSFLNR